MSDREQAVINEILRKPLITGKSAIAPFVQLRRRSDEVVIDRLWSINVQTGEAELLTVDGAGQPKRDDAGNWIMETVYLDLNLYYLDFKTK